MTVCYQNRVMDAVHHYPLLYYLCIQILCCCLPLHLNILLTNEASRQPHKPRGVVPVFHSQSTAV